MIPRGAVRGISFDYGHVLGGLDLDELGARIGSTRTRLSPRMNDAYAAHDAAIARGEGHEAGWRALMKTLVAPDVTDVHATVDRLWAAQPTRNLWRYVPDAARALLRTLQDAGVRMVVTSNSEGRVRELLEETGIAGHFVAVLDSGLLGFAKPDPRIFALAARSLDVPLTEVVHVGDSEAADVAGAKDAGAYAVRFDGFLPSSASEGPSGRRATRADARTSDFDELTRILLAAVGRD